MSPIGLSAESCAAVPDFGKGYSDCIHGFRGYVSKRLSSAGYLMTGWLVLLALRSRRRLGDLGLPVTGHLLLPRPGKPHNTALTEVLLGRLSFARFAVLARFSHASQSRPEFLRFFGTGCPHRRHVRVALAAFGFLPDGTALPLSFQSDGRQTLQYFLVLMLCCLGVNILPHRTHGRLRIVPDLTGGNCGDCFLRDLAWKSAHSGSRAVLVLWDASALSGRFII